MMHVLETLARSARERVARRKREVPEAAVREMAFSSPSVNFAFQRALRREGLAFVCECKKASPSKGVIAPDYPYLDIARAYEAMGADAISVLTEPTRFLGEDAHLERIASQVGVPCLRKDFTVEPYMVYEARALGASAVLLIVSILTQAELRQNLETAYALGMSALVEVHDETEMARAADAGASIIGVNNRDLADFSVDLSTFERLAPLAPKEAILVAESGLRTPEDVSRMARAGAKAVLVGEAFMRARDKAAALRELRSLL